MGFVQESVKDFTRAVWSDWLARMSGPLSVPAAALALWVSNDTAKILLGLTAFICLWVTAYRVWKPERDIVIDLKEKLRPKIKVLDIHERHSALNAERTFELEIENDSEVELSNCLAKVTAISLFKMDLDGKQIDYSAAYRHDLPLALRTVRSVDRGGGGPFHLRAHETKKIPICSRQDGIGKDLSISFEPGVPEHYLQITFISTCDLEIEIYGAPNPPKERLHLAVENGKLTVTRNAS